MTEKKCFYCKKEMAQVFDTRAGKKTGYLWKCKCMPKNMVMSIG